VTKSAPRSEKGEHMQYIKEVEAQELAQWLESDKQLRVIDVREIREINAGTIDGAIPLPLATLPLRINEFTNNEEKLVVICRSGARSAHACGFMQQNGFNNVYNLRGGILSWAYHQLPLANIQ